MQSAGRRTVVDVALNGDAIGAVPTRANMLDRLRFGDALFHQLTRAAAVGVLILLGAVILSLIIGALPALRAFGFNFLIEERWNPVTEKFGALAAIYGTIITSFLAMLIAVPVGLLISVFLTELCPPWLRRPIGIAIEFQLSNCGLISLKSFGSGARVHRPAHESDPGVTETGKMIYGLGNPANVVGANIIIPMTRTATLNEHEGRTRV